MLKETRDDPEATRALASASVSSPLELKAGDVLAGKYLLVRPLGVGGMGQVWFARNLATHADVAAKVLLPERLVVGDALERFRREAQATASLWHRGIVRAFDLVELDPAKGSLLMVMELLHGQTLAHRLEQAGRLSVAETLRVVVPILSALDHAHRVGLVHRDLKPDNVFLAVDPDGEVIPKLVDFGISKMRHATEVITARGALIGTPFYMAPEQARGDAVDARSDVFAIGILLHECLSGAPPFGGDTLHDVVRAVLDAEPRPIEGAPPALQAVIARALAKRADDRYPSAAALAEAIIAAVPDAAGMLRATSTPPGPSSVTSVPPAVSHTTIGEPLPRSRRALVTWCAIAAFGAAAVVSKGIDRAAPTIGKSLVAEEAPRAAKRVAIDRDVVATEPMLTSALPTTSATITVHRARAVPAQPAPDGQVEPPPAPAAPATTVLRDPGF